MPFLIRFLGTSASRPTVERGVSSLAVVREGETFLFDCGEGTQRQMMRYGVSFALNDLFFTHFHVDHFLGVVGLLRTLALQGRTDTMRCYGPKGAERVLRKCESLGADRLPFALDIREMTPGDTVEREHFRFLAVDAQHRGAIALSWAIIEDERLGRFEPQVARDLGIPEGPLWGRIHRGEAVTLADGRVIEPSALVGPARPGRRVVITGDTRPCEATIQAARNADLLIHEATFSDEEADRARETGHSTAREAATVARESGARRLLLTHISARYSHDAQVLEREARSVFPRSKVARDGLELDVPYQALTAPSSPTLASQETI